MKDKGSSGNAPQHFGDNSEEGSNMDRIEANFRLVMLSIRELELVTRSTAEDVRAVGLVWEAMKNSLERQRGAVVNLAGTMEQTVEAIREVLGEQESIKKRLSALEQDVADMKS